MNNEQVIAMWSALRRVQKALKAPDLFAGDTTIEECIERARAEVMRQGLHSSAAWRKAWEKQFNEELPHEELPHEELPHEELPHDD